jgi:hypothetical protein
LSGSVDIPSLHALSRFCGSRNTGRRNDHAPCDLSGHDRPPHRALSAFSAAPSHLLFPLVSFPSTFTLCFLQLCYVICTIIQLCNYCLIVLILQLSAAFPKLHKVLRQPGFVSPGNGSSNLSQVPPVGCWSPLCAW